MQVNKEEKQKIGKRNKLKQNDRRTGNYIKQIYKKQRDKKQIDQKQILKTDR